MKKLRSQHVGNTEKCIKTLIWKVCIVWFILHNCITVYGTKKHKAELHEISFFDSQPLCLLWVSRNYKFLFETQCENFDL